MGLHVQCCNGRLEDALPCGRSRRRRLSVPNAWIAGPTAPSRVEGMALEWPDKPAGIDIRYAVQLANGQMGSGRMVPLGTYAGTRGRALPLTAVVLEMSGTDELEFVAEAGFLNAPTLRAVGKRVVLSGPTNREPLVGIRIGIERVATAEQVVTPAKPRKPAGSARVRGLPQPAARGECRPIDHGPIGRNRIMNASSLFEHDVFGKPVSAFPDHAPRASSNKRLRSDGN